MSWVGPCEVTGVVNSHVCEVVPLTSVRNHRREHTVHIVRIRRFSAAAVDDAITVARLAKLCDLDFPDNEVKDIVNLGKDAETGVISVLVKWLGFSSAFDTWEPFETMVEDVPKTVERFLRQHQHTMPLCAELLGSYFN
jgi:hypothetical protein